MKTIKTSTKLGNDSHYFTLLSDLFYDLVVAASFFAFFSNPFLPSIMS